MPDLTQLSRTLVAYTMWADREHLVALEALPADHLVVPTGTSFGTLLGTISHILGTEQAWLARFVGAPLERQLEESEVPDLAFVRAGFEELWAGFGFFLAGLSEAQLLAELAWTSRSGTSYRRPLWEPLFHLSHHSGYHRGQLTAMQRQLGHPAPPAVDLIKYLASR
jgi:uncharacterized damage-inducible protein DinB